MKNFRLFVFTIVVSVFAFGAAGFSQSKPASSEKEVILDRLIGSWDMTGEVECQPAEYRLDVTRVLHDKFILLKMVDLRKKFQYVADVHIGYDTARSCYVTFWLDNFGVDSAVTVLGYGRREGNALVILFSYPGEPFRDTFTHDTANDTWRFLLEDGNPRGIWKTFADIGYRAGSSRNNIGNPSVLVFQR